MMRSPCLMTSKSDNTMSTSEVSQLVLAPEQVSQANHGSAGVPQAVEKMPLSLPDPAVLARMANEFFTALPDGSNPPLQALPVDSPMNASSVPEAPVAEAPVTVPAVRPEL